MLNVVNTLPMGLLELEAARLHELLPGPTLIDLPGRREQPLFISVLLHGNETTGWLAARELLRAYAQKDLPRALSLFIANVAAARANERFLPGQPDYNRIWEGRAGVAERPEYAMVESVLEHMRPRGTFAAVDIHNTTGINPHYANVRHIDHRSLHLATLFGRTVVYSRRPRGMLITALAKLCPAVTVECGQPGKPHGVEHAREYVEACLHLSEIPNHPVAAHDIDLFHSVAIVKVPPDVSFGFTEDAVDIRFVEDLDHLNFRELPVATTLGWVRAGSGAWLEVRDELGREVSETFFQLTNGELRTRLPVIPSLLTLSIDAIRQDCLCYLMERYQGYDSADITRPTTQALD
jgi:hypothetical protein